MTATVREYYSTDASAPTLNGTAGSLLTVLSACLVNGYGSRTAAGWTEQYTGTNKKAYRTATGQSCRPVLRVDDSNAQESRLVMYGTMSDVDTGTDPIPTSAQLSGGFFGRKSNTADATARPWKIIACEYFVYIFFEPGVTTIDTATGETPMFMAGVFPTEKSGDAWNYCAKGSGATGAAQATGGALTGKSGTSFTATANFYLARAYTQSGSSIQGALHSKSSLQLSALGTGGMIYPDPITGGLRTAQVQIAEADNGTSNYVDRGLLPGLWNVLHNLPAAKGDTFGGTGDLAGKTFRLCACTSNGSTEGRLAIETSGSWGL
ncbi:MAG: hypothetical protein QM702_00225 [Rubrivivax sp.]